MPADLKLDIAEMMMVGLCLPHRPYIVGGAAFLHEWLGSEKSRTAIKDIDIMVNSRFPLDFCLSGINGILEVTRPAIPSFVGDHRSIRAQVGRLDLFVHSYFTDEEVLEVLDTFPLSHQQIAYGIHNDSLIMTEACKKTLKTGVSQVNGRCRDPDVSGATEQSTAVNRNLMEKITRYRGLGLKFEGFQDHNHKTPSAMYLWGSSGIVMQFVNDAVEL